MKRAYLLTPRWRHLRLIAVLLAVIGQVGIVNASLTLARDESSSIAHTEQSGTNLHHGHNEATCPACAALSFHTTLKHAAAVLAADYVGRVLFAPVSTGCAASPLLLPNSCRAPPSREV